MARDESSLTDESQGGAKLPSKKDVSELRTKYEAQKNKMDELRGDMGSTLKSAEESKGFNRKAFKQAVALTRKDPAEASSFIAHFEHYCEALGLKLQASLPLDDDDGKPTAEDVQAAAAAETGKGEVAAQASTH